VRKSQSPKLSPSQFEPELVWTMRSVLDSAVDQIDVANRTPATRAKMAERILRAASDGITDPRSCGSIVVFRSAMITVRIGLHRLCRHQRIDSIESAYRLMV
jgi:hypothetical protein